MNAALAAAAAAVKAAPRLPTLQFDASLSSSTVNAKYVKLNNGSRTLATRPSSTLNSLITNNANSFFTTPGQTLQNFALSNNEDLNTMSNRLNEVIFVFNNLTDAKFLY